MARSLARDFEEAKTKGRPVKLFARAKPCPSSAERCAEVEEGGGAVRVREGASDAHRARKHAGASHVSCDRAFGERASNEDVFEHSLRPLLAKTGLPHALFVCWGTTATGKSHTLIGSRSDQGLLQRTLSELLLCREHSQIALQALHISSAPRQGVVRDAFSPETKPLRVGSEWRRARSFTISHADNICDAVNAMLRERSTRATNLNEASSRSHLVLRVRSTDQQIILADCAGSEFQSDANPNGHRAQCKEAGSINFADSEMSKALFQLSQDQKAQTRSHALPRVLLESFTRKTSLMAFMSTFNPEDARSLRALATGSAAAKIEREAVVGASSSAALYEQSGTGEDLYQDQVFEQAKEYKQHAEECKQEAEEFRQQAELLQQQVEEDKQRIEDLQDQLRQQHSQLWSHLETELDAKEREVARERREKKLEQERAQTLEAELRESRRSLEAKRDNLATVQHQHEEQREELRGRLKKTEEELEMLKRRSPDSQGPLRAEFRRTSNEQETHPESTSERANDARYDEKKDLNDWQDNDREQLAERHVPLREVSANMQGNEKEQRRRKKQRAGKRQSEETEEARANDGCEVTNGSETKDEARRGQRKLKAKTKPEHQWETMEPIAKRKAPRRL